MTCYHFTMKLDRKPDKSPVKAETHLDYINRDGQFKDIDFERAIKEQQFVGNMLCPPLPQNKEGVKTLYRSLYGSVIDNGIGIESSDKSSIETLQLSLALAQKQYGSSLDVQGSTDYKAKIIVAASEMDMPVTFVDEMMNKQYNKLQEEKEHGRERFRRSSEERERRAGIRLANLEPIGERRPPARRNRMQIMSVCGLDENSRRTGMLLPRNIPAVVEQQKADGYPVMRRDVSRKIREKAEQTAEQILSQNNDNVLAASHVDYINRKENYAAKGGCIFTANHLPNWAKGSAKKFFKAADTYERANGTRYREIEFALPNELNLDQQKEIISKFIDNHLKDHYYAYAVHDKIGAMSNGEHNTHVHIMFSERELDDLEKNQERTPEMFFHRANSKDPSKGGCKKAEKWRGKDRVKYLCHMREDFAEIQNKVLAKYGIDKKVDHRSLKDQYIAALKANNPQLARLLKRVPEPHIGPVAAANKHDKKVIDLLEYRAFKLEQSELIRAANAIENDINEEKAKNSYVASLENIQEISQEDVYQNAASDDRNALVVMLKKQVLDNLREITALNNIVIWQSKAELMAKEKFMTLDERTAYRELEKLTYDRDSLCNLRNTMQEPTSYADDDTWDVHKNIMDKLALDIDKINKKITLLEPTIHTISERLSDPAIKKQLQLEAEAIMQGDLPQKEKLNAANEKLQTLLPKLRAEVTAAISKDAAIILKQEEGKTTFTAKEVAAYLKQSYIYLSSEYKQQQRLLDKLSKQVISFDRAAAMAKNNFLNGSISKLNAERRALEKEEKRIAVARLEYQEAEAAFKVLPKPKWYQGKDEYNLKQEKLVNMQTTLSTREHEQKQNIARLDSEAAHLEQMCASPAGKAKISAITAGILKKNKPIAERYNALNQKAKQLSIKLTEVKELQKNVHRQIALDAGKSISYTSGQANTPKPHGGSVRAKYGEKDIFDIARAMNGGKKPISKAGLSVNLSSQDKELDYDAMDQTDRAAEMEKVERLL